MNNVTVFGNLTKDCTTTTSNDKKTSITRFTLADNYTDRGDKKVNFWNVTAFGKAGETIAKYCKKGSPLLVTGTLRTNAYTDKEGNKREYTEIILNDFTFTGGKPEPAEDVPAGENPFGDK